MAVDLPKMEPTESMDNVEDFAHSKLIMESIKNEIDGVSCDVSNIEHKEYSAEFVCPRIVEGNPDTQMPKEDTKQIVKVETSENIEDDENCDIPIDAELQVSTDDSCIISDDFLISLDDENAEAMEDFGEPENAKNTNEAEQLSANGFNYEIQGSHVVTNVDDSFCSNTGRNVADLDENVGEIIQNYNSAGELCKKPNNLHHNSDLESIQRVDDVDVVVNTDKICDTVVQEAISKSGFEEDKVSPRLNICDLEKEMTSVEFADDFVDERNFVDSEQTSIKEDGASLISSQGVSSECGAKLAKFTDDLVDEVEVGDVEKVVSDGQKGECQTFAGQSDVYPFVSSPLENENKCGGQAGNEASDICHVFTSCENEICRRAELESFHGERTTKLDAEKMTSPAFVNFDDQGVGVDTKDVDTKDVETKSNSQSSKVPRADGVAKNLESRSDIESARLDKGKHQGIPALNDVHAKKTNCPETKVCDSFFKSVSFLFAITLKTISLIYLLHIDTYYHGLPSIVARVHTHTHTPALNTVELCYSYT